MLMVTKSQATEISRAVQRGLSPLAVPEPLRLSQWAAEHFYMSAESSYVEGRFHAFPYQVGIMDLMSNDDVEELDFKKSARVGYTKMLLAFIGYNATHRRRNQAVWQPTDDDSDEFCKTELDPMIRDVPIMQTVFPSFMMKHKDNTLRQKKFLGSMLHLRGGKAAKNYRRISVDVAIIDESDGFDVDVEGEGSPVTLSRKRTEGATFPKHIIGSTPKIKDWSLIDGRYQKADIRLSFHIRCPHCDQYHDLRWGAKDAAYGFKFFWSDPENTVTHQCLCCGEHYTQADYLKASGGGRWQSEDGRWLDEEGRFRDPDGGIIPTPRHVGVYVWTAYSPRTTWAQIAREFVNAWEKARTGNKTEIKAFWNTTLGEPWEEAAEKADAHELQKRAEPFPLRTVPLGGLVLVAAVDVQDNRFEIVVWAIGRGEESWTVDYQVLEANPALASDWDKLDAYLTTKFPHAAGGALGIEAAAVDTQGHFTHQAYAFCRARTARRIYAIRGEPKQGQPIKGRSSLQDVNWNGKVIKSGVKVWAVGTDTAKDLIYGRLQITAPGPGYMHFSKDLPSEFYHQLTAEHRVLQKTASGEVYRWVKIRPRNEVLDCTVYSIFAAYMLDLHRYTEQMWQRLENAVQPATRDMFIQPVPPAVSSPVQSETKTSLPEAPPPRRDAAGGLHLKDTWSRRL